MIISFIRGKETDRERKREREREKEGEKKRERERERERVIKMERIMCFEYLTFYCTRLTDNIRSQ